MSSGHISNYMQQVVATKFTQKEPSTFHGPKNTSFNLRVLCVIRYLQ